MFFFLAVWLLVTLATASSLLLLRFVVFLGLLGPVAGLLPAGLVVSVALPFEALPVLALPDEARLAVPVDGFVCDVVLAVDAGDFFGLAAGLAGEVEAFLALAGAVFFFGLSGALADDVGWDVRLDAALPLAGAVSFAPAVAVCVVGLADERLRVFGVAVGAEAALSAVRGDDLGAVLAVVLPVAALGAVDFFAGDFLAGDFFAVDFFAVDVSDVFLADADVVPARADVFADCGGSLVLLDRSLRRAVALGLVALVPGGALVSAAAAAGLADLVRLLPLPVALDVAVVAVVCRDFLAARAPTVVAAAALAPFDVPPLLEDGAARPSVARAGPSPSSSLPVASGASVNVWARAMLSPTPTAMTCLPCTARPICGTSSKASNVTLFLALTRATWQSGLSRSALVKTRAVVTSPVRLLGLCVTMPPPLRPCRL